MGVELVQSENRERRQRAKIRFRFGSVNPIQFDRSLTKASTEQV